MKKGLVVLLVALMAIATVFAQGAQESSGASKELTAYIGYQEDEAQLIAKGFERDTGIKLNYVRLSAGEMFTRVQAEAENPQASIMIIGADTIGAAVAEGLIEPYKTSDPNVPANLMDPDGNWTGHSISVLCFGSNTKWLKESGVNPPESWQDLLKPEYKGNVCVAHPGTSGVAFTVLSGLVTLMGEDQAYDFLKKMDKSVVQYTKGGAAPARMVGLGETGIGLCWFSDLANTINNGYEITISNPVEGAPYEVTSIGIIKNGPKGELENAKKFIDWAVSKSAQEEYSNTYNRLPVNTTAVLTNGAKPFTELNTFKIDTKWASANKKRLVQRFVDEVRTSENVLK